MIALLINYMHNSTFYMVAAMTLYAVTSWFVISAMIQGVRAAISKPNFNKRAFIGGWLILTLYFLFDFNFYGW